MSTNRSTLPRLLAVTALAGGLALASPAFAADASSTTSTTTTTSTSKHHHHMMHEDVETRIKSLHDKLQITPAQEDSFNSLAQVMRDNDADAKAAWKERRDNGATRTAVEDLESYQKIAQTHADASGKLLDAFKPLYDSMSDDQKKNADDVFGRFEGHRDNAAKSAAKTTSK